MKRIARKLLYALLALGALALLALGLLAWQIDRLGQQDEAQPADVIVVLGARVEPGGRPGSDLTSRTYHAVDLWQAGYAPYLICTGGFKDDPFSAAAACRRFAIELGVPADLVMMAGGGLNTRGDAEATAAVMAAHGWRSAILVSHPLHLYRARWLFRRAGVDAFTSPTSTRTDRILLPLRLWYAGREAGAMVMMAFDERGWLPIGWLDALQLWGQVVGT